MGGVYERLKNNASNPNIPSKNNAVSGGVYSRLKQIEQEQQQQQEQQFQSNMAQVSKIPTQQRFESAFGPANLSKPEPISQNTQSLMNKVGKPTISQGVKDYTTTHLNAAKPYENVYERSNSKSTNNKISVGDKIGGFLNSGSIPSPITPKTIYQFKNDTTGDLTDPVKRIAVAESKNYYYTRLSDGSLVGIKKTSSSETLPTKEAWSKEKVKQGSVPVKEPNAAIKFNDRIADRLYEATGGVSSESDTGNAIANFAADTIGTLSSFAQPSGGGTSFGNLGNQIGKNVVAKLESKGLQKIGGKVVNGAIRGGIEGATSIAPVSFGQAQFQGLNAEDTAKKVLLESAFGGGLGAGFGTIGGIIRKVKDGKPLTMQEQIALQQALEPKNPIVLPQGIKETYTPQQRPLPKPFQNMQQGKPDFLPQSKFGNLNKMIENTQNPQPIAPKQGAKILPKTKAPTKSPKTPQPASKETLQRIVNNPTQYHPDMVASARAKLSGLDNAPVSKPVEAKPIPKPIEANSKLSKLESDYKQRVSSVKNDPVMSAEMKASELKRIGMQHSANKRKLIQGDSLMPVEGGLTGKELQNKINYENSNYYGKKVTVEGKTGTVESTPFGKVKVRFEDGTTKVYPKESIQTMAKTEVPKSNIQPIEQPNIPKSKYTLKSQKGISKFGQTVKNSERIDPKLKSTITDTPYGIKHNDATWKAANERVNKNTEKEMADILTKADSSSAEDVATGMALMDKFNAVGKYDEANRILEKVTKDLTDHGQAIQAANMWKRQTPQGMLKYAYKQWENAASKLETPTVKEIKSELTAVRSKIDSLNAKKTKVEVRIKAEGKTAELAQELDDIDGMIKVNLQLFGAKQKMLPKVIRDLQPTPKDTKFILEHMEKFKNAKEDKASKIAFAKIMQRIADRLPATAKEKFMGLQRISLLSGPKSLVTKNPLSNVLLGTVENIKDIPTSFIDKAVSLKTGNRTTTISKYGILKEGQVSGAVKGVKDWASDVKNKIDTSPTRGMMELPSKRIFKNTTETRFKAVNKALDVKSDSLNFADQVIRRALQLGDRPFYESWRNSRVIELNKLNKTNKTKLTANEIEEQSKLYALDKVFQNNSDLAQRARKIKDGLGLIGDVVMPFTQTPANVLDKLIDYSPAGFGKGIYHLGTTSGKGTFNQKLFVDRIGRALTGTSIGIFGYVMAKNGIITGRQNKDKDVADMEKNAGKNAYAFKIGDTYRTFDWAQPVSGVLAIGADAYYSGKDKKDFLSAVMAGAEGAGNTLVKQSMFQGLTNMFSGYSPVVGFGKTLLGAPLQAAPTGGKQISQLIDPYVRETYDPNPLKQAANKFIAKIPFATKTLPIKQDSLGNDIKAYQGKNNVWNVMLNPGVTTKYDPTPVQAEVLRLYDITGIKDQFPRVAAKSFEYQNPVTKTKDKIQLSADEYVSYQKYLGTMSNDAFDKIISSKDYAKLPDDSKVSTDLTKTKLLKKVLEEANQLAKVKVLIDRGIIKLPKKQ